jgi:hypothetical protein
VPHKSTIEYTQTPDLLYQGHVDATGDRSYIGAKPSPAYELDFFLVARIPPLHLVLLVVGLGVVVTVEEERFLYSFPLPLKSELAK